MFGKDTYSSLVLRTAGPVEAQPPQGLLQFRIQKGRRPRAGRDRLFRQPVGDQSPVLLRHRLRHGRDGRRRRDGRDEHDVRRRQQPRERHRRLAADGLQPLANHAGVSLESLLIAMVGGAIGCALGSLVDGWQASSIVSGGAGGGKVRRAAAVGRLANAALGLRPRPGDGRCLAASSLPSRRSASNRWKRCDSLDGRPATKPALSCAMDRRPLGPFATASRRRPGCAAEALATVHRVSFASDRQGRGFHRGRREG